MSIKNIDREDMGEYACSVRNDVGAETSEGIFLNVQCMHTMYYNFLQNYQGTELIIKIIDLINKHLGSHI